MRVRTCCRDNPSRGTPSAKVSAPSAPGSQRCRMKRETYALGRGGERGEGGGGGERDASYADISIVLHNLVCAKINNLCIEPSGHRAAAPPPPHTHNSLELFLRLPSQVSDQPLGGEGVLWGHPITHHCVQEGLSLARVEAQHLDNKSRTRAYTAGSNTHTRQVTDAMIYQADGKRICLLND